MTAVHEPMRPAPQSTDLKGKGSAPDKIFAGLATGSGVLVVALVTAVAAFLLVQAIPSMAANNANFFSNTWDVSDTSNLRFGIGAMLWTTVISSLLAMAIATPIAIGVALYLTQYAPKRLAQPLAALVDLLAAVPSIIYGLWGIKVLYGVVSPVQDGLQAALGWFPLFSSTGVSAGTIFLASIVLAIMILPIITALSRDVFAQTPLTHKEGALALGATRWEMIRTAVLPFGKPGVISAAMLGLGRALGETVAVLIILSTVTGSWSWSVFNGGETFASKIAASAQEFDSPEKTGAYIAAGLVLFILTFIVNAIARVIIERRKAFSE